MKTNALRKAISIICVLAMLLSVCIVSFASTASAETESDATNKTYTLYINGVADSKTAAVGDVIPVPENDGFLGWYDASLTTEYTTYPEDVDTLVAKFEGVQNNLDTQISNLEVNSQNTVADDFKMDFENDFKWSVAEANNYTVSTGNSYVTRGEIVTDNEGDKAFQLSHFRKKNGNHYFTVDDGNSQFELTENTIYTVQFDYFVKHSETPSEIRVFMVDPSSTNGIEVVGELGEFEYRDDTEWTKKASCTFITPSSIDKKSLAIGVFNATNVPQELATVVLFDNVVVKTHSTTGKDAIVVFDSKEGSDCDAIVVEKNKTVASLPTPTKYGYVFDYWKYDVTTGEGDNQVTKSHKLTTKTKIPEGVLHAYAKWSLAPGFVELDFRTNVEDYDAKVKTIVAPAGGKVTGLPVNPEFPSQKFAGWYLDSGFTKALDVNCAPSTSTTLYAKWETSGIVVNFEDYTSAAKMSDRYKIIKENNGNRVLSHSLEYGTSKSPTAVARAMLQVGGKNVVAFESAPYTVKFKYKVEDFKSAGKICIYFNSPTSIFANYKEQTGAFNYTGNTDGWLTGEITFTATIADTATSADVAMSIGCNGDATIYIDDIVISCPENIMNIYGSAIRFNTNGGKQLNAISGDPGDNIVLPTPIKKGYKFVGWYTDSELKRPFTRKKYGTEPVLLYAKWQLGEFNEGFEEFPASVQSLGIAGAYSFYDSAAVGFDSPNIKEGKTSLFRNGATAGVKNFTLMRSSEYALTVGEKYTLTFYVKPTAISDDTGNISLMTMDSFTGIASAAQKTILASMADLKEGEWQKIVCEFTADSEFLAISTTDGNDIYFDDINIKLVGFVDSPDSGDSTVSPIIVLAFVIVAAGTLVVTGKKVFSK